MRRFCHTLFHFLKRLAQKRFMYFVALVVILVIVADKHSEAHKKRILNRQQKPIAESQPTVSSNQDQVLTSTKTDSLVAFALSLEGIPYVYAGKSLSGFDCSGFTYFVYNKFGFQIPAGSANQFLVGEPVDMSEIKKGDLVFFTGTQKGDRSVGHVGIVVSEDTEEEVEFVHSSSGGGGRGVTTNSLEHPHYKARFLGARRVVDAS